jgi:thiamine biosynthesis lipoprotein
MNTPLPWLLMWLVPAVSWTSAVTRAADPPSFVGPAMGTTYRVTLAADLPGMSSGDVHREVDRLLDRLDRGLSTWRADSDASRFNRAKAGQWIDVSGELVAVVELARLVHAASAGAFDITVAPSGSGRPVGMRHVETRSEPPALRKTVDGIALDLGGIGPGYAVDAIGGRLAQLRSTGHLVELGGEVRAWGRRGDGEAWRVRLRHDADGDRPPRIVELRDGAALATATCRPGRSPIDPRTGRPVTAARRSATVHAASCAVADAWAVAALVLDLPADGDGMIRVSAPD